MFRAWIKAINPLLMIVSLFPFSLGAGMADYFGHTTDPWRYLAGQLVVLMLLAAGELLFLYGSMIKNGAAPFSLKGSQLPLKQPSPLVVILVISTLLVLSVLVGLRLEVDSPNASLAFLFLAILTVMTVVLNGNITLRYSGYAEIIQALMLGSFIPAFSYITQTGSLHPLLLPATLPFVLIWMATCLVFELATYGGDVQMERRTLLIRLGWQRGMLFHHILLLVAYIFIGLTPVFGLAWRLAWPVMIALPASVIEIWLINRVALGWPPRWLLLKTVAVLNFILPVYLLTSRFWLA